jgi:hypothetical protein
MKDVNELVSAGILRETSKATEIPRPPHLPGGTDLIVRHTEKGIFGVAEEDNYFKPIPLNEDDIRQFEISIPKLAERIRRENSIAGGRCLFKDGLLSLGQKTIDKIGSVDVYMSFPNLDEGTFLVRCRRLERSAGSQRIFLLTPRGIPLSSEGRRLLDACGAIVIPLVPRPDNTLALNWNNLIGDLLKESDDESFGNIFRRHDDFWMIRFAGKTHHLRDSKGLFYISILINTPDREYHAAQLFAAGAGMEAPLVLGSAGQVLDERARKSYQERIEDLQEGIREAEANNDLGRKQLLQAELDELITQLANATGLGGRNRTASDDAEKVRKSVSMAITRSLSVIKKKNPELWRHLKNALNMGQFLSYSPDSPIPWVT